MHIVQRIIARVKVNENGCWIWDGPRGDDGYGLIRLPPRKTHRVHRVMYAAMRGDPGGMLVCHECDTPLCVNPLHLFLGTPKQNTHDAMRKGRLNHGTSVNTAKLDPDKVLAIVEDYERGATTYELSRRYGVAATNIGQLLKGKTWRSVERKTFARLDGRAFA